MPRAGQVGHRITYSGGCKGSGCRARRRSGQPLCPVCKIRFPVCGGSGGRCNCVRENSNPTVPPRALYRNTPATEILGRFRHWAKCFRICGADSVAPQRQPQGMRGPSGRPLRLDLGGNCRILSPTFGRCGHSVKCFRIWLVVTLAPQSQPHGMRGPGDRPWRLIAVGSSRQISIRTQLLQRHRPIKHRPQNRRAGVVDRQSAPQQRQIRSLSDVLITLILLRAKATKEENIDAINRFRCIGMKRTHWGCVGRAVMEP